MENAPVITQFGLDHCSLRSNATIRKDTQCFSPLDRSHKMKHWAWPSPAQRGRHWVVGQGADNGSFGSKLGSFPHNPDSCRPYRSTEGEQSGTRSRGICTVGILDHFCLLHEYETGWDYRNVGNSRYLLLNKMYFIFSSLLLSTTLKEQKLNT